MTSGDAVQLTNKASYSYGTYWEVWVDATYIGEIEKLRGDSHWYAIPTLVQDTTAHPTRSDAVTWLTNRPRARES